MSDPWATQRDALGAYIRSQPKLANLSLRQLAELTSLSNPYLSQIERGLHQPSVRVLRRLSDALNVSAETLLAEAGLLDPDSSAGPAMAADPGSGLSLSDVEAAIRVDQRLGDDQKAALIIVYQSMLSSHLGG